MDINTNYSSSKTYAYGAAKEKTKAEASSSKTDETCKTDTFEKTPAYKPDMEKINALKMETAKNISAFKQMVQGVFQKQGNASDNALGELQNIVNIDKATQLKAQEAISENGEWGVEATANRILDFAKSISGGDPGKIELLKTAVLGGFAEAEKIWGGKLPDICNQTKDRIMEGFDQWADSSQTETVQAE